MCTFKKPGKMSHKPVAHPIYDKIIVIYKAYSFERFGNYYFCFQKVITQNVLGDKNVASRQQWEEAVGFIEDNLMKMKKDLEQEMQRVIGPDWVKRLV